MTQQPLIIGISSRALFNLSESHQIFQEQGVEAYRSYQIEHEKELLQPGVGFRLVNKILHINDRIKNQELSEPPLIEVVLISRNSADTGLRVFHSIEYYGLAITCATFSGGSSAHPYARAFGVHLFLSAEADDVIGALEYGVPAAVLLPPSEAQATATVGAGDDDEVHIAFDGDAVLFADDAERIFRERGVEAFLADEKEHAQDPMRAGPFLPFLRALQQLQESFPSGECPTRTALVTARSAPAHERAIRTLREWGIRVDEAFFVGGADKGKFLSAFGADIFFDDKIENCTEASSHTPSGHVPDLNLRAEQAKKKGS